MLKFKDYVRLREMNTVGYHNDGPGGGYLSSDQTGSEAVPADHGNHLPSTDLKIPEELPTVVVTSTIRMLERNKNPIFIFLDDGTKLYLTWQEFNRIGGKEPEVGRQMRVVFLRRKDDSSESPSQIQQAFCY